MGHCEGQGGWNYETVVIEIVNLIGRNYLMFVLYKRYTTSYEEVRGAS